MSTSEPVTNGPNGEGKYIDKIDPDDPEYIRQMRRPAEVKEDLTQMGDRKRVNQIMNTKAFREELEQLVAEQMKSGPHPTSLMALQQISELILPQHKITQSNLFNRYGTGSAIPISDIRGVDSLNYSKGEKVHRGKCASLYRVADLLGWSAQGKSFITTRLSQDNEHFLGMPQGLMFQEVTAGNLCKVDMGGDIVDSGTTGLGVNRSVFAVHAAVHASRPDIKCIVQLRNPHAVSLASVKLGLMPVSQEAVSLGDVTYYDYSSDLEAEDRDKLSRALGPINKVLVLRNYGVLVGGQTIEEAFYLTRNLMTAVDIQMQLMPLGVDNILIPSEEAQQRMLEASKKPVTAEGGRRKWRRGEMEFEAFMRHLDNAGYRTGHVYHEPLLKKERRGDRVNSEVEIPPASSSFQYSDDDPKVTWYHESLLKKERRGDRVNSEVEIPSASSSFQYSDDDPKSPLVRMYDAQKKQHKTEWLNTPNSYKREEMQETGTPNPKKYTKWVAEAASQGSTPVKVENPNQFAPQGENPKEYKQKFKAIKKEYYEEHIDAGPQSRILEGVSWEEAQKMKDQGDSTIVVGAASKGIIQRDHQHNAVVYKQTYAANPFSGNTEEDLERYQQEISGKGRPDDAQDELVPGPDGKLISTEERLQNVQIGSQRQAQDDSAISAPAPASPMAGEKPIPPPKPTTPKVEAPPPISSPVQETDQSQASNTHHVPDPAMVAAAGAQLASRQSDSLPQDFQRSKSERKPKKKKGVNGEQLASPAKSLSSGEGTLDERSSREVSPTKEAMGDHGSPEKHHDDKKKKKFRMPSFSKTKDKKVKEKKSSKQSAV